MSQYEAGNHYFKCYIENEVIIAEFTDEIDWNLEKAKECVRIRLSLSNGNKYPILLDARNVKSISLEARKYLSSDQAMKDSLCAAAVIESNVSKVMGNFYLILNKPKLPFKLFTNKKQALKWLNKNKVKFKLN